MAGLDRILDPETGDYVKDGKGSYVKTNTVRTKLYHQVKTYLGFWWGDFQAGSAVYRVTRMGANTSAVIFVKNAVRSSLAPFLERGLIKDLNVEAEANASGRIIYHVNATDTQGGRIDIEGITPIG